MSEWHRLLPVGVDDVATILAILTLVVGVPLNLYVVLKLRRLFVASPEIRVLRERGIVATAVLIVVVVFGGIFLNNDMATPVLDTAATKLITRIAVLVLAVGPALYWLRLYRGART